MSEQLGEAPIRLFLVDDQELVRAGFRMVLDAQTDMSQVVMADPVPAGATILGSGLGRDSAIASAGNAQPSGGWLASGRPATGAPKEP